MIIVIHYIKSEKMYVTGQSVPHGVMEQQLLIYSRHTGGTCFCLGSRFFPLYAMFSLTEQQTR